MQLEELFDAVMRSPEAPWIPSGDLGQAIEDRRAGSRYTCPFCNETAQAALYVGISDLFGKPRWLDVCWRHYNELRVLGDSDVMGYFGAEELVDRFELWQKNQPEPLL